MKIDSLTLKNGEVFNLLFPPTKLRLLKSKNIEYYKNFNDLLNNPKKQRALDELFEIVYCSYLVNSNGNLTFEEFLSNYPEEYDNFNDLGYIASAVISKSVNVNNGNN